MQFPECGTLTPSPYWGSFPNTTKFIVNQGFSQTQVCMRKANFHLLSIVVGFKGLSDIGNVVPSSMRLLNTFPFYSLLMLTDTKNFIVFNLSCIFPKFAALCQALSRLVYEAI